MKLTSSMEKERGSTPLLISRLGTHFWSLNSRDAQLPLSGPSYVPKLKNLCQEWTSSRSRHWRASDRCSKLCRVYSKTHYWHGPVRQTHPDLNLGGLTIPDFNVWSSGPTPANTWLLSVADLTFRKIVNLLLNEIISVVVGLKCCDCPPAYIALMDDNLVMDDKPLDARETLWGCHSAHCHVSWHETCSWHVMNHCSGFK